MGLFSHQPSPSLPIPTSVHCHFPLNVRPTALYFFFHSYVSTSTKFSGTPTCVQQQPLTWPLSAEHYPSNCFHSITWVTLGSPVSWVSVFLTVKSRTDQCSPSSLCSEVRCAESWPNHSKISDKLYFLRAHLLYIKCE